mgnify:CR=1 FL=1
MYMYMYYCNCITLLVVVIGNEIQKPSIFKIPNFVDEELDWN